MNTTKTTPSSLWASLIGLLAVLALLGVFAQTARRNSGNLVLIVNPTVMTGVIPSGSPPPLITLTPETEPTEGLTDDWSATETAWPMTQVAARATFEVWQTANPLGSTPIVGIHDFRGPEVYPQYIYENEWSNYINENWVVVFAGSYSDNPNQGLVVFAWNTEFYETPIQAGSVHIVAEDNFRLTLLSTDGTTFYFDIPARRFVDSLTEVVPTATPVTPSPTPTSTITPTFDPTWLTPWPTCTPIPPSLATDGPCGP